MPPKAKFTKEQIIEAALNIVREEGVQNLTARALGKKLGSSACPIFTVFESMEEVQAEMIKEAKKLYAKYIEKGLEFEPAFKGTGMQYIIFAKNEPQLFQLLFMSEHLILDVNRYLPTIDENYDVILASVRDYYSLTDDEAKYIYTHMGLYSHGIATLYARKVCMFSLDDVSRMLTEVFSSLLKDIKGDTHNDWNNKNHKNI